MLSCKAEKILYQSVNQNDGRQIKHQLLEGELGYYIRYLLNYLSEYYSVVSMTHFSLSPSHLETRSDEEIEKKVELFASVATALAR